MKTTLTKMAEAKTATTCMYFLGCTTEATTTITCGPLGEIQACEKCAAFYKKMS